MSIIIFDVIGLGRVSVRLDVARLVAPVPRRCRRAVPSTAGRFHIPGIVAWGEQISIE